jgi:hypothetical protein
VDRSIAEGHLTAPLVRGSRERLLAVGVGLLLAAAAFGLYWWSHPVRYNQYIHFVWQADAFLHGRDWIPYPIQDGVNTVTGVAYRGVPDNAYYQDVYPLKDAAGHDIGRVLLPFPPLPAVVLMPFVALFGLFTDEETIAIWLGALGVLATWWMLGGLRLRLSTRTIATLIFATGTAWWWASAKGTTWYLAHLVAFTLAMLAVGITLRHDRRAADETLAEEDDRVADDLDGRVPDDSYFRRLWASAWPLDRSQMLAGLLLGLSVTARLPLVFATPWFMFVGGGGTRLRRTVSTGAGAFLPVAALLGFTFISTGSLMNPGYDYQYQREATGYTTLGYNPAWSVEDIRYIPQNLGIMFGSLPVVAPDIKPDSLGYGDPVPLCVPPDAQRSVLDPKCPLAMPVDVGTSILLSAPGLLLALLAFRRPFSARLRVGATGAVVIIGLFNLAHFSQGWVQWGYRFSLDFMPFLLPLVALGAARADGRPRLLAYGLLVAGVGVNLWGVTWGQTLGW